MSTSSSSGRVRMHPHRPLYGAGLVQALLVTEAVAMLWLAATGLAQLWVAVASAVAVTGCCIAVRCKPHVRGPAAVAGLVVSAGALAQAFARSDAPGLVPAVVLTLVLAGGILIDERRRPQRKDIEDELAARADELARAKDQLLAVVSHELRTPVTGVMGFAKTMATHFGSLDQDTMRLFVRSIEDHSTRLARLIDNLVVAADGVTVDGASMDGVTVDGVTVGGSTVAGAVSCDLSDVIASVIEAIEDGRHKIEVSARGPCRAQIDGEAARLVITNLVDNAVKFADEGTPVRLNVGRLEDDLVVDVTNVGPVLPQDLTQRLYQPFVQADSSDSRLADGLGLGLHVVRQLVEGHGGCVELVQASGLVTFRVRLPAETPAVAPRPLTVSGGSP